MKVKDNQNTCDITCKACKSTLKIGLDDLEYHYNFGHDSYLYVVCGACHRQSRVEQKDMPADWKSFVNNLIFSVALDD